MLEAAQRRVQKAAFQRPGGGDEVGVEVLRGQPWEPVAVRDPRRAGPLTVEVDVVDGRLDGHERRGERKIDPDAGVLSCGGKSVRRGETITIDGGTGYDFFTPTNPMSAYTTAMRVAAEAESILESLGKE